MILFNGAETFVLGKFKSLFLSVYRLGLIPFAAGVSAGKATGCPTEATESSVAEAALSYRLWLIPLAAEPGVSTGKATGHGDLSLAGRLRGS